MLQLRWNDLLSNLAAPPPLSSLPYPQSTCNFAAAAPAHHPRPAKPSHQVCSFWPAFICSSVCSFQTRRRPSHKACLFWVSAAAAAAEDYQAVCQHGAQPGPNKRWFFWQTSCITSAPRKGNCRLAGHSIILWEAACCSPDGKDLSDYWKCYSSTVTLTEASGPATMVVYR